jgi:hypothetical protein
MLLTINKDDGKEFEGSLNEFMTEEGTHVRKVSRYDHAGNGRIESVNCAILDAARTIYAVKYAALVSNHIMLHGKHKCPAVLMGKLQISPHKFLRFGSQVHFHVPKDLQRGKIGLHALPGIFLGLTEDGFSYMIQIMESVMDWKGMIMIAQD